jgi:hypothetical protein
MLGFVTVRESLLEAGLSKTELLGTGLLETGLLETGLLETGLLELKSLLAFKKARTFYVIVVWSRIP